MLFICCVTFLHIAGRRCFFCPQRHSWIGIFLVLLIFCVSFLHIAGRRCFFCGQQHKWTDIWLVVFICCVTFLHIAGRRCFFCPQRHSWIDILLVLLICYVTFFHVVVCSCLPSQCKSQLNRNMISTIYLLCHLSYFIDCSYFLHSQKYSWTEALSVLFIFCVTFHHVLNCIICHNWNK